MIPIEIQVKGSELCAVEVVSKSPLECFPITRGSVKTPTPLGRFQVESITRSSGYKNPWLIVFETTDDMAYAIHSWNSEIPVGKYSKGCIRLNSGDIDKLINNYLFTDVVIDM